MIGMFVNSLDGTKIPLICNKHDKVKDLERRIQKVVQFENAPRLMYQGIILTDDNQTIEEYKIPENSSIGVIIRILGGMQIFVMTEEGRRIALEVIPTDKIIDIKKKIEDLTGINPEEQRIIFNNKTLVNDKTIQESNIVGNVVINVVKRNKIRIIVSTSKGQNFAVDVGKDNSILEVRNKVALKTGLNVDEYDLIFHGDKLTNDKDLLCDYDIEDNDTFSIIAKLPGGLMVSGECHAPIPRSMHHVQ